MGLYNFKAQFVPHILDGSKTHTIRAERKGHNDMPGGTMHLYTGLRQRGPIIQKLPSGDVVRQKMARLLMRAKCVKVEFVRIETDFRVRIGMRLDPENPDDIGGAGVPGGFLELDQDEKNQLAKRDGFRSFPEMMEFWKGRLPFEGNILHWRYKRP